MGKEGKRIVPFRVKQQAVDELKNGLEIYEVSEKYGITIQSVRNWQKQVDFGVPGLNVRVAHKTGERSKAVREIRSGLITIEQAMVKYQIRRKKTIMAWMQENTSDLVGHSPSLMPKNEKEAEELDAIKARCLELETALANAILKNASLETLIDVAEKELKIDIRKKSGTRQSR